MTAPFDLRAALQSVYDNGDPFYRHTDQCPACEGTGRILTLIAFIHHHNGNQWVECWDCSGTGKGSSESLIWKDISRDE